jgi:hypothetical protein
MDDSDPGGLGLNGLGRSRSESKPETEDATSEMTVPIRSFFFIVVTSLR